MTAMIFSRFSIRSCILATAILILVIETATGLYADRLQKEAAASYFSYALGVYRIHMVVTVHGTAYTVDNGEISAQRGACCSERERFDALATAYAVTLARRSPILDMEGTDPQKLRDATDTLENVANELASAQAARADQKSVAHDLYPIAFLRSLADLEAARQAFIASGRDTDEAAYRARLDAAIAAGARGVAQFTDAYRGAQVKQYALLSGVVTPDSSYGALQSIADRFTALQAESKQRTACLTGMVDSCALRDLILRIPKLTPQQAALPASRSLPPLTKEILSIRTAAGNPYLSSGVFVSLLTSSCLSMFPGPYLFIMHDQGDASDYPILEYMNDMLFSRLSARSAGPFQEYGVSYLLYTPTTFYACPESARDLAHAAAVIHIGQLARSFSAGKVDQSDAIPAGVVNEADVIRYLQSEFSGRVASSSIPFSLAQRDDLIAGLVMLRDNSAGLDQIVTEIALFDQQDYDLYRSGANATMSPYFLFSARSDFYALFLSHNPSAGARGVNLYTTTKNPFPDTILRWSQLRTTVSPAEIARNITGYQNFHIDAAR